MTTTTPPEKLRSYGHFSFDSRILALTALSHKIRHLYSLRNGHLGPYFRARAREFIAAKRELENNFQWRVEE